MTVTKMRAAALSPDERRALDDALKDPARFHNDWKMVGVSALVIPVLCVPLIVVLAYEGRSSWSVYGNPFTSFFEFFPRSILSLFMGQLAPYTGIVAMIVASIALIAYALRTRGKHGVVVTTFGVVRIRGGALRVLRFADIDKVTHGMRRPPQHKIITTELDVIAKDGTRITLYGDGTAQKKQLIEQHLAV